MFSSYFEKWNKERTKDIRNLQVIFNWESIIYSLLCFALLIALWDMQLLLLFYG